MAEVDNYHREDRGGGRYGGFNNKRKRNRDDDDNETERQRYGKRRERQVAPPGSSLRKGLCEIGENQIRMPHEQAMHFANLAVENWEDEYVRDVFKTVVLKLVTEQPLKIPFVTAVVLFAHDEKKEVITEVVTQAGLQLQEYLEKGQWRETKLMLRFLACLSRVFAEDGVLPILDELFNRAVDLQTASQEDAVGLELVKIILLTIPYLLAYAEDAGLPAKALELLERTDIIASTPHAVEPLVDPYPTSGDDSEKPMACASVISLLQRQLQDEAANGWPLKVLIRIYDSALRRSTNGATNGESNGDTSAKITFPPITVPSPINQGPKTLFPELYFSIYADSDIESVPPTTDLASTVVRDAVVDTVNILSFNRNAAAGYLKNIDCFWSQGTFAPRGTAFDTLRETEAGRSTWKPEDVIIDAVFSQIFVLPAPEHRLVYYHSVITESCKIGPQEIAPTLGRAIRFLYRGLDIMDWELGYRYLDWFAHHLSNFDFRWKWTEWTPELALSALSPKKAFIEGALDKEIRLSFAKRIRDTLPPAFRDLIPASKDKEMPDFKFASDQTPFAREGQQVLAMIKKKAPEEEIQKVLDSVHEQAAAVGISDPLMSSTDIYVTAILYIGSKSLSHVLSTIDRCKERLISIGTQSETARRQIIQSVIDFWATHPGTAVNIVDKLLNYTIVTPINVIQWSLIDNMDRGRALASPQIYELISITMFKVTNRVHQLLNARNSTQFTFAQRQGIDETLPREREGMRELFRTIEDAVAGVAAGAQDEMIERFDEESAEQDLIKAWGGRWARVWRRKAAVEEQVFNEGASVELVEPPVLPIVDDGPGDGMEDMDRIS